MRMKPVLEEVSRNEIGLDTIESALTYNKSS